MESISIKTTIKTNKKEIEKASMEAINTGLQMIGASAEGFAKENCPVDTGRLRNSITFALDGYQSPPNTNKHTDGPEDAKKSDYELKGNPEKCSVYVGTNVEYAGAVEFRDSAHKHGRAHFLRDAVAQHGDNYEKLMKAALLGDGKG